MRLFLKKYISDDIFYKIIFVGFILSVITVSLYTIFVEFLYQLLYYYVIIFFGILIIKYQKSITSFLRGIKIKNSYIKPILVGYFMVLFEEFFAALFNHLSEGFSFSLFLIRIFQFQFFNILAFTGIILSLVYILKRYEFSKKELFIFIGIFSIFSEGLYSNINLLIFLSIINAITYCIIFYPIYLSIDNLGKKKVNIFYRFLLFILIITLVMLFVSPLLDYLREIYPWLFPPGKFIPL